MGLHLGALGSLNACCLQLLDLLNAYQIWPYLACIMHFICWILPDIPSLQFCFEFLMTTWEHPSYLFKPRYPISCLSGCSNLRSTARGELVVCTLMILVVGLHTWIGSLFRIEILHALFTNTWKLLFFAGIGLGLPLSSYFEEEPHKWSSLIN